MKNLYKTIIALVIISTCFACEDIGTSILEFPESSAVTTDTMFSSQINADKVLSGIYSSLPVHTIDATNRRLAVGTSILENLTDLVHCGKTYGAVYQYYYSGTLNPLNAHQHGDWMGRNSIMNYYDNAGAEHWRAIRQCHVLLDNVDGVPDMSVQEIEQMKGEALCIKAFHYYNLFRNFGGVPWVDKAFLPTDDLAIKRSTVEAMVDSICATCDLAASKLDWAMDDESLSVNAGRWTKAGAMALKAKVLLFAASPLFNADQAYLEGDAATEKYVWYGNYDVERWQRLYDLTTSIISKLDSEGGYALEMASGNTVQDYRAAFRKGYFKRESKEVMASFRTEDKNDYRQYAIHHFWGDAMPTMTLLNLFPMSDGTPIDESNEYDETNDPYGLEGDNPKWNRDPRFYETVLVNKADWDNRKAEFWVADGQGDARDLNGNQVYC